MADSSDKRGFVDEDTWGNTLPLAPTLDRDGFNRGAKGLALEGQKREGRSPRDRPQGPNGGSDETRTRDLRRDR
jgi:hypothetical protein